MEIHKRRKKVNKHTSIIMWPTFFKLKDLFHVYIFDYNILGTNSRFPYKYRILWSNCVLKVGG